MKHKILLFAFALFVSGVIAACSRSDNPVNTWMLTSGDEHIRTIVLVSDVDSNGRISAGTGLLGVYNLYINPVEKKAELSGVRNADLADTLEFVDITNFLRLSPCTDCAKIKSISFNGDGKVVLTIGIKHPFDTGDPFKPISGRNRADLHVFNVEGTFISKQIGDSFDSFSESIAGFRLLNADGYSPYADIAIEEIYPTDATIHPYITHFDDYSEGNFSKDNEFGFESVTDPPPSGYLVMPMGSGYDDKDYSLDIPDQEIEFIFAVSCTFAVAADSFANRFSPEYRMPQHNKKAASEVSVTITGNELTTGDTASEANLEIHVVDINHGVAVGSNLDEMFADSSVKSITIEIPGVELNPVDVDISSPTGSGHDPSDPLIFEATITNSADASPGFYPGLVKVLDNYEPGQNTSPVVNENDGIKRVDPLVNPLEGLFTIDEFATYQVFTLEVVEGYPDDVIYVDNSHTGPLFEGTRENPYDKIQDGIDNALDGYTILVDDSGYPYEENISLKDGTYLISENFDLSDGAQRAFIDGPNDPEIPTVLFKDISDATISGFQIGFSGLIEDYMNFAISVDGGSGNTVRDCSFSGINDDFYARSVYIMNSPDAIVEHCRMSDIDSAAGGMFFYWAVYADSCPNIIIRNNLVTNIRNPLDYSSKHADVFAVYRSDSASITNNLVYNLIPLSMGQGAHLYKGIYVVESDGAFVANNTCDLMNVIDGYMVQQIMAYYFETCTNVKFTNNIASRLDAVNFPAIMARGVQAVYGDVTCDYSCMWDVPAPYFVCPAGSALEGAGCTLENPLYIDSTNEDYEIDDASPAQAGDPSLLDWDDDNSGGNESRSRMGCTGGPGGEIIGLLT